MEDVAKLVDRIIVMHSGRIVMDGKTRDVFSRSEELESIGLGIPQITKFMKAYKAKGHDVREDILTVEEAKTELLRYIRRNKDA